MEIIRKEVTSTRPFERTAGILYSSAEEPLCVQVTVFALCPGSHGGMRTVRLTVNLREDGSDWTARCECAELELLLPDRVATFLRHIYVKVYTACT